MTGMRHFSRCSLVGVLLALGAMATLATALADAHAGATAHRCSTGGMPNAVRTITARDCARARTVVRAWFHRLKTPGGNACIVPDGSARPAVCRVGAWRCTSVHTVNGQTYPVTCTADGGRRRVHFVNRV
jgi:hypothetical protein